MSIMTCLIIFSGSSARSIMSFRLARIKVPTRSKSPIVILLSNHSKSFRSAGDGASVLAHKPSNEMQKSWRVEQAGRNQVIRHVGGISEEVPGQARQQSDADNHQNQ